MAKFFTILLSTFLSVGCEQAKPTLTEVNSPHPPHLSQDSSGNTFTISFATPEAYQLAKGRFQDKMKRDTLRFPKLEGVINLPRSASWQEPVVFRDSIVDNEENTFVYNYLGQFENLEFYVVEGIFYEYYECYLIDKRMGYSTTTWNIPVLSPGEKYFANLSMDFGLEGTPIGIQIWKITDDNNGTGLEKYLEIAQQKWAPADFVWETDSSLILKVFPVDAFWETDGELNEKQFFYLQLKL